MVSRLLICILILLLGGRALAQSFTSHVLMRDIGGAWDVNTRDYDGDGDFDVLASTWIPGGVFYGEHRPGDTLATVEAYVASSSGRDLASGDFDGDGDVDGVFASYGEDRYIFLRNEPAQVPSERFDAFIMAEMASGPNALVSADVSGDGVVDLVATELRSSTNQIRIFQQIAGSLEEVWLSSLPHDPLAVTVADLNGDGTLEILIATATDGGLYVMRRNANGGYAITQDIPNFYLAAITAGDLDNDGAVDIICGDFESDVFRRWEWNGTGWTLYTLPGSLNNPRAVSMADFNSDGLVDFAGTGEGQNGGSGGLAWWRQTASGAFVYQSLSNQSGFVGLDVVDFDRDGDGDLIVANREIEQVLFYENLMGSPTRIIGHVTAERGGEPIANARVTAVETGVSTLTDPLGYYALGMIEGTFTLRIEHACWATTDIPGVQTVRDDTTYVDEQLRRAVIDLPVTSLNLFIQNEQVSTYEYSIGNTGDADLRIAASITGFAPEAPWASVVPGELTIAPGQSGSLTVTLTPDTTNEANYEFLGELVLRTNSCPDTVVDVALVIIVLDAPERGADLLPMTTGLLPAYPNPFNPVVTIPVAIADGGHYAVRVYDILGREVAQLFDGPLLPGRFAFTWQASGHASGRYMAVLTNDGNSRWETPLTMIK